jgi:CheY-like chemotaxis protein
MRVKSLSSSHDVVPVLRESLEEGRLFDICIIDAVMPGLDGYDLVNQVRALETPLSDTLLLVLSSAASIRCEKFMESGFDGFLPKPVRRRKMLELIRQLLTETRDVIDKSRREPVGTEQPGTVAVGYGARILLVEDNPINRKLAHFMLSKAGYRLTIAENGREAVDTWSANRESLDLILMDIQMPRMDGIQAAREIRKLENAEGRETSRIPIIAMTAQSMKGDREKCLGAGMDDYISKPIHREVVFEMIKKWVIKS